MADTADGTPPYRNQDGTPFVYFDVAAAFGVWAGAIEIELAARILTPVPDGSAASEFVSTARLRCSPAAAEHLKSAIEQALQMLQEPQKGSAAASRTIN